MNVAPICSATFTWPGVMSGLGSSNRATPPLTTALAMLVPVRRKYAFFPEPAMCHWGYFFERYDPDASSATSLVPGATTSGFTARSYLVGPFELYGATVS